jgi:Na+/H+-dicarboxylate symporter
MNSNSLVVPQSLGAKTLAVFSIASFWAIPFAPFVTIAALKKTKGSNGWARRLAVSAAVLCSVYTIAIAVWVFCLTIYVLTGRPLI